jgi:uncharacterized protein DUF6644
MSFLFFSMSLQPFFLWMNRLAINDSMHKSEYLAPAINLLHLLSMVMFMGALVMVDLRLLGTGMKQQSLRSVARQAQPWLVAGFMGLLVTGIPATTATAVQQYGNQTFWLKMYILGVAIPFTFIVRRFFTQGDEARPFWGKAVGLTSMVLWLSVALTARLIMLLP